MKSAIMTLLRSNSAKVLLLAVLLLPILQVASKAYFLSTLIFVAVYALPAIGLSLLSGMCGQLAISHGAFFAIGAYGSALLALKTGMPPLLATALTTLMVVAIAFAIGGLVLRLRSHYLIVATLSFAIIVEVLLKEWAGLTGGLQGLGGIPPYRLAGFDLASDDQVAFVYWAVALLVFWFSLNLSHSRIGRVLRGIREGEVVVNALGTSADRYKTMVYVVSSLFAGMGGSMYAHYVGFLTPSVGSIMFAIDTVMVLALGGFDLLWGSLAGVVMITGLNEYALGFAQYKRIALGLGLLAVMLVFPDGLLPGLITAAKRHLARRYS